MNRIKKKLRFLCLEIQPSKDVSMSKNTIHLRSNILMTPVKYNIFYKTEKQPELNFNFVKKTVNEYD